MISPEFAKQSINSLRVVEDAVAAALLFIIIGILLDLVNKVVLEGPMRNRLRVLAVGFFPFLLWKLLGAIRRVFIEKGSEFYSFLEHFGEAMEALSGLAILAALIFFYLLIKPSKKTL